jgi:stearoyl-CoA desaturase (delta-9 desaturase)
MSTATRSRAATFWLGFRFVLFGAMHVAVLVGVVLSEFQLRWIALCAVSFLVRSWGVTVGYHRYFAHRSFKTSRPFQLFLAVLAQSANQNGVLWWAARHRHHHAHSDQPADVHSPVQHGFLRSHLTWFMYPDAWGIDESMVKDWMKVPELVWLQRVPFLPTLTLGIVLFATLGWEGLLWGHFVPTVLLLHATYTVNSLSHVDWVGTRPYDTPDHSRNHFLLALITLGEGWHNNHHHRPGSARFGWRWYQIDIGWWGLVVLEKLGLVWDVRRLEVPAPVDRTSA